MGAQISPLACVDPQAELAETVEIGPFCYVGPAVRIGGGTRLISHVHIGGHVTIGRYNQIFPGAVIGGEPQDLSYRGSATRVVIGDHNVIREGVTINRASEKEDGSTTIGNHGYFMACSHVAHDCKVGDHVVLANATLLGGHVHVHDYASLSGAVAVHHFTTIGRYSFLGGMSRVLHDVPPYMLTEGNPARPRCINVVALRRNDFPADVIDALSHAHRLLYRSRVGLENARDILLAKQQLLPQVQELLAFIQHQQDGCHGRARQLRRAA